MARQEAQKTPTKDSTSKVAKSMVEEKKVDEAQIEPPKTPSPAIRRSYSDDQVITLLETDKKKRGKSAERLALYRTGMTVGQYLDAAAALQGSPRGRWLADIRWDVAHGFIEVGNAVPAEEAEH